MEAQSPARLAASTILDQCLKVRQGERLLVVTDDSTEGIGRDIWEAGLESGLGPVLVTMPTGSRDGAEPPTAVACAMSGADVIICPTKFSLTHTRARREACENGARAATLPGITREVFEGGALQADYDKVSATSKKLADLLTRAEHAVVEYRGRRLEMSLAGRSGHADTGVIDSPGMGGNLPGGEAFIAPLEGTAEGELVVDGSMLRQLMTDPLLLKIKAGRLVSAEGPAASHLLDVLGNTQEARNVAELGIGCNPLARITGIVLEDEKVLGTVHVAFGTNSTFGGVVSAGVHVDGIVREPDLYLDGVKVLSGGRLLID